MHQVHGCILTPITNFEIFGVAMNFPLNSNTVLPTEEVGAVPRQRLSSIIAQLLIGI